MAQLHLLLALASVLCFSGTTSAQDFASGGEIVSGIGSAIQSLMSNTSSLQQAFGALRDPGSLVAGGAGGLGPQEVLAVLEQVRRVGPDCLTHMGMFVEAASQRQEWAIRMLDAVGKPPAGLLNFKLLWQGDWDECTSTEAVLDANYTASSGPSPAFRGQYCPVSFPLPVPGAFGQKAKLTIGACFPDSCSAADISTLMNLTVSLANVSIPEPEVSCQQNTIELDTLGIVGLSVLFAFLALITVATLYDIVYIHWLATTTADQPAPYTNGVSLQGGKQSNGNAMAMENAAFQDTHGDKSSFTATSNGHLKAIYGEKSNFAAIDSTQTNTIQGTTPAKANTEQKYKPTTLESILLSFSAFTNGTKILNTHQPPGALTAVNGIRFLSMAWVICGHGFAWSIGTNTDNTMQYVSSLVKKREFTPILNGTFSVDSFFVLSGVLVSYLSLKQLKMVRGMKRFNWAMYYFHRFWRLSPPYFLLFVLYVTLDKYLANGPMWPQDGFERDVCRKSWWTNVLYINNLVKTDGQMLGCFGWTWYLANDMQFYIVSPLILILLYYVPILGSLACLGVVAGSAISSGLISMYYELPSSSIFNQEKSYAYMWYYYVKPWCRIGPYAIGLFTGYLLYRSQLKARINRVVNVVAWLVAIGLGCFVIYCLYAPDFQDPLTTTQAAIYNATARNVWGAAIAWMIYACANGYGGPIQHVLSWPGFVPLGRLTYFAYLVHPMVMSVKRVSMFHNQVLYDYGMVYILLGHFCMAYSLAFVLSLMFEAPMMGLEKVLLGRKKST